MKHIGVIKDPMRYVVDDEGLLNFLKQKGLDCVLVDELSPDIGSEATEVGRLYSQDLIK